MIYHHDVDVNGSAAVSGYVQLESPQSHLHYSIIGTGQPLLFIHGNFNDHEIWKHQAEALGDKAQIIRYDLRGYGNSSTPHTPFSHVEDLMQLMKKLRLGRVHLIGSSMGGGVAIDFALEYPAFVQSITLVAPSISGQGYPLRMLWKGFRNYYNLRRRGSHAAIDAFLRDPYWRYFIPAANYPEAREMVIRNIRNSNNFCRFSPQLNRAPVSNSMKRLHEIKCPTLIVLGAHDHSFNKRTAEKLLKSIQHATQAGMHDCGHLPFVEQPESFNQLVMSFIEHIE